MKQRKRKEESKNGKKKKTKSEEKRKKYEDANEIKVSNLRSSSENKKTYSNRKPPKPQKNCHFSINSNSQSNNTLTVSQLLKETQPKKRRIQIKQKGQKKLKLFVKDNVKKLNINNIAIDVSKKTETKFVKKVVDSKLYPSII